MQAIAVLPEGLEFQGAEELSALGAKSVLPRRRSVAFQADMSCFYRLHLKARLPFRLLREMARFQCDGPASLYQEVQVALEWERWLHPSMSFRVDVSGSCQGLTHSHFSALQVKNAVVDFQRKLWGERSDVNLEHPDLCLHLHLSPHGSVLSLDGSGGSLHRRGYRAAMGIAPLKENLAAGLIRLSNWDGCVPLVDPLCGSGTFLIEAASIALGLAPGLNRTFNFEGWADFDKNLWEKEKAISKLQERWDRSLPEIIGCENDLDVAQQAQANVCAAGLEEIVKIQHCHFSQLKLPNQHGLIVCNPPYGKRIGLNDDLSLLYEELGLYAKHGASGWQFWILSGNQKLTKFLRMKASLKVPVNNGGIDCRWLQYLIN